MSSKITVAQKLPIIKAESRWKTVINSVVSSIKTKKNVRNHKARNQHLPMQTISNDEVSTYFIILYYLNIINIYSSNYFIIIIIIVNVLYFSKEYLTKSVLVHNLKYVPGPGHLKKGIVWLNILIVLLEYLLN